MTYAHMGAIHEMEARSGHFEYREVVRVNRNEARKVNAHLELILAKDVKEKKGFFKYINTKGNQRMMWDCY